MTQDDILSTVQEICCGPSRNDVITPLLQKLIEALPHTDIIGLIYWNPVELTPEQIVDEAMRREAEYARKADLK
jgi:hypothetical protein